MKYHSILPLPLPSEARVPGFEALSPCQELNLPLQKNSSHYSKTHPPASSDHIDMKLDTHAIRYLTSEDWRVLTAVRLPSSPPQYPSTEQEF